MLASHGAPAGSGAVRPKRASLTASGKGEPAHEHADLRYFMATGEPEAARPENPGAPLRWLTLAEARDLVGTNNLRHTLDRAAALLAARPGPR